MNMAHPANETCPLCRELVRENAPLSPSGNERFTVGDWLIMACGAIVIVCAITLFLVLLGLLG